VDGLGLAPVTASEERVGVAGAEPLLERSAELLLDAPRLLVLNVRNPDMLGLELLKRLVMVRRKADGTALPRRPTAAWWVSFHITTTPLARWASAPRR
jgi:hypothetical protein